MRTILENLDIDQRDQIFDLLKILNIGCQINSNPIKSTFSIEVFLNDLNADRFEGVFTYIYTYINNGESHDYQTDEHQGL